ncbi:MAG: hypothetical protein JW829_05925, partial [Pirellulales bacterium]|nr:hypothetical protein [Pirellulales bacterium]
NQPLFGQTVTFRHTKQDQEFSPIVEFRAEVNYHLSKAFALKLGFNATFIDNIRRASRQTAYVLPSMGFIDGGTQDFLASGVYGGFEVNH